MFFRLENKYKIPAEVAQIELKQRARKSVLSQMLDYRERTLNNYLLKKYNYGLKSALIKIIDDVKFYAGTNDTVLVIFKDRTLEEIAALITYGNSEVRGTDILRKMFGV